MNSYLLKQKLIETGIKDKDFLLIDTLLFFYNKKKDKDGTVKALPKTMCKECFYDGDQTNTTHFLKPIIKRLIDNNLLIEQKGDTWILGDEAIKLYTEFYAEPEKKQNTKTTTKNIKIKKALTPSCATGTNDGKNNIQEWIKTINF